MLNAKKVILGKLGKAHYITPIDLTKGFRHLTAFQTDLVLMQFRMMPFGLVNALQIFCRVARRLLQELEHVENYVDDIFIFTVDWKPHLDALRAFFSRLREHGGTARPSKCEIGFKHIDALVHFVGGGEMRPQVQKVDKILQVRYPQVKKAMCSFLGMVGYYRKFVENFASIAKPLTDKSKKGEPNMISWDKESMQAFEMLKDAMSKHPVLRLSAFDRPFILTTDASNHGIGAVLLQEHDGMKMPVSRKLKNGEEKYSTIEWECFGLVWATKRLHTYLYGREFILETDHQPLLFLDRSKLSNDRIMRWALAMQIYGYRVSAIKG